MWDLGCWLHAMFHWLLSVSLDGRTYDCSHFTAGETEAQSLSNLPKIDDSCQNWDLNLNPSEVKSWTFLHSSDWATPEYIILCGLHTPKLGPSVQPGLTPAFSLKRNTSQQLWSGVCSSLYGHKEVPLLTPDPSSWLRGRCPGKFISKKGWKERQSSRFIVQAEKENLHLLVIWEKPNELPLAEILLED